MRRTVLHITLLILMALAAFSCQTGARYEIRRVEIDTQILDISAGYVRVTAQPNRDAYYAMGVVKKDLREYDPYGKPNQFMTLMLDSLYLEYTNWRYPYLKHGVDYIASFESHSLHYDSTEVYFNGLIPDTKYWLYSFPVDPYAKTPTGSLKIQEFTTQAIRHQDLHFDVSINGYFVLVYPRDENDNVLDNTAPFYSELLDSALLVSELGEPIGPGVLTRVGEALYQEYCEYPEWFKLCHTIDEYSYEDEPYATLIAGHTYYLLISVIDGSLVNRTVFKFTWTGPDYQNDNPELYFREGQNCPH